MTSANCCVEVNHPEEFVKFWACQDGTGELVIESALIFIFNCKCRGIHRNQGEEAFLDGWKYDSHCFLIDCGRNKDVLVHKLRSDGEAYPMSALPLPEVGVISPMVPDAVIFSWSDLA